MMPPMMSSTLAATACSACGTALIWPRHACPQCDNTSFMPTVLDGSGTIYSITKVHRPPTSDEAALPYTIALIELDVGGRLMARVPDGLSIGDRVTALRERPQEPPDVVPSVPAAR